LYDLYPVSVTIDKCIPGTSWDVATWSAVEVNAGLFCASAPAIKPLLRRVIPGLMASSLGSSSNPTGGYGKSKSNTNAFSGLRSRVQHPDDALELRSAAHMEFGGAGKTTNTFWVGDDDSEGKDGDSDSTKGVLRNGGHNNQNGKNGLIMKTVSVHVTDERPSSRSSNSESRSTKRFEHV
jgi:hypothetical protein